MAPTRPSRRRGARARRRRDADEDELVACFLPDDWPSIRLVGDLRLPAAAAPGRRRQHSPRVAARRLLLALRAPGRAVAVAAAGRDRRRRREDRPRGASARSRPAGWRDRRRRRPEPTTRPTRTWSRAARGRDDPRRRLERGFGPLRPWNELTRAGTAVPRSRSRISSRTSACSWSRARRPASSFARRYSNLADAGPREAVEPAD